MQDYSGQGCAFSHCSQCLDLEHWKVQGAIIIYDKKEDGFLGLLPVDESNEDESDETSSIDEDFDHLVIITEWNYWDDNCKFITLSCLNEFGNQFKVTTKLDDLLHLIPEYDAQKCAIRDDLLSSLISKKIEFGLKEDLTNNTLLAIIGNGHRNTMRKEVLALLERD
jgi:hypothetical protein